MGDLKMLERAGNVLAHRRSATLARLTTLQMDLLAAEEELTTFRQQRRTLEHRVERVSQRRRKATTANGLNECNREIRSLIDAKDELAKCSIECRQRLQSIKDRQQSLRRQLAGLAAKADHLGDRGRREARRQLRRTER